MALSAAIPITTFAGSTHPTKSTSALSARLLRPQIHRRKKVLPAGPITLFSTKRVRCQAELLPITPWMRVDPPVGRIEGSRFIAIGFFIQPDSQICLAISEFAPEIPRRRAS